MQLTRVWSYAMPVENFVLLHNNNCNIYLFSVYALRSCLCRLTCLSHMTCTCVCVCKQQFGCKVYLFSFFIHDRWSSVIGRVNIAWSIGYMLQGWNTFLLNAECWILFSFQQVAGALTRIQSSKAEAFKCWGCTLSACLGNAFFLFS